MGKNKKRKREAIIDDGSSYQKRTRPSLAPDVDDEDSSTREGHQPRPDLTTGLRSAFPDLDTNGNDDELFYGPASDGMEYLRMVRSEAKGVPNILVAATNSVEINDEESDMGDGHIVRGYYADGAYTAVPTIVENNTTSVEVTNGNEDPQDVYRQSLLLRYRLLRANLRINPPEEALAALDENHPIVVSKQVQAGSSRWQELFRQTDPLPAQVAAMDQTTVLRLIGIISTGHYLKKHTNIPPRVGRWIWALLGRVEEIGCLTNDEVAVLRELGKRAAFISRGAYQVDDEDVWDEEAGDYIDDVDALQEIDEPIAKAQSAEEGEIDDVNTGLPASEEQIGQDSHNDQGITANGDEQGEMNGKEPEITVSMDVTEEEEDPTEATAAIAINAIKERILASISSGDNEKDEKEVAMSAGGAEIQEATDTRSEEGEIREGFEEGELEEEGLERLEEQDEDESFPSSNTLATLDMVLTIVGEVYGQRDLLKSRQTWQ
ncbi:MAG: aspartate--tRNA ligase dps1 [Watsoniomyces obsoletus]|nr:MAG: aspartate--tRNA ligase dps1 [Watsoniomyces obsoletus]